MLEVINIFTLFISLITVNPHVLCYTTFALHDPHWPFTPYLIHILVVSLFFHILLLYHFLFFVEVPQGPAGPDAG